MLTYCFKYNPQIPRRLGHFLIVLCSFACTTLFSALSNAVQPQNQPLYGSNTAKPNNKSTHKPNNSQANSQCPALIPNSRKNDAAYLAIKGVKCFETGDYPRAYELYIRALEIQPNPTLYGAIGRVLHELGIYSLAAVYYQEYLDLTASSDANGTRLIEERLEQIETLLQEDSGTIEVVSAPANATVFMILPNKYWLELGQTPLKVQAQTGKHQLVIVGDGFYRQNHKANLNYNGKSVLLNAELVPENDTFNVTDRQWRRAGTWTIISGAPIFVTGVTLLFIGHNDISSTRNYIDDASGHTAAERNARINRGNNIRNWGAVATAIGTTAVLTGAILYVNGTPAPDELKPKARNKPPRQPTSSWTPILDLNQVGIQFNW